MLSNSNTKDGKNTYTVRQKPIVIVTKDLETNQPKKYVFQCTLSYEKDMTDKIKSDTKLFLEIFFGIADFIYLIYLTNTLLVCLQ